MLPMTKPVIEIDGLRFDNLDDFWEEISTHIIPGVQWGRNFDALNDILRGGFGTPEGGFVLRWLNSRRSRQMLGYPETLRWLEWSLQHCPPENIDWVKRRINDARCSNGPTLFDTVVKIICIHSPGGAEEDDGIELELC